MSEYLLELQNVTKEFKGGTVALDDISYSIDAASPSIVSIAGESGSGKTTMGMMILGFLDPIGRQGALSRPGSAQIWQAADASNIEKRFRRFSRILLRPTIRSTK